MVFAAYESGVPYSDTGMSSQKWLDVPVQTVCVDTLIATQQHLFLKDLVNPPKRSFSGDEWPHVVHYQGKWYLEDGHHRVVRAVLMGDYCVAARVLEIE